MVNGLHGPGKPAANPTAGVINVLLVIAFGIFLLSVPGLRDLFSAMANPFLAR